MEEPDPLLTDIEDCFTVLWEIDQLVESQASLVEQICIKLNQVVKLIQSENNAFLHHTLVHLCNTQINEVIVELELQFVVEKYEWSAEFLAFGNHDIKATFARRVSSWLDSEKTEDVRIFEVQRLQAL